MSVLVLLVGRNPLPNWVVYEALCHPDAPSDLRPSRVLLVHSKETAPIAERLQTLMPRLHDGSEQPNRVAMRLDVGDPRDRHAMTRALKDELAKLGGREPVHLNYTGGTKEMAVTAFAVVQDLSQRGPAVTYSYLDPDQHRLRFHDRDPWPARPRDLRDLVALSLEDLMNLHHVEYQRAGDEPLWPTLPEAIFPVASHAGGRAATLERWCSEQFGKVDAAGRPTRTTGWELADGKHLRRRGAIRLPSGEELQTIFDALRSTLGAPPGASEIPWDRLVASEPTSNAKDKAARKLAEYFHGKWLEHWLWQQTKQQIGGKGRLQVHGNVEARRAGAQIPAELDVVLLHGYQLFVFSCTTAANRGLVKSKAFEAMQRSQQFGGDEARPVLATLLPHATPHARDASVQNLVEDLAGESGSASHLRIWGRDELADFGAALHQLAVEEDLPR